jgi:hypothetical protein
MGLRPTLLLIWIKTESADLRSFAYGVTGEY